MNTNTGEIRDLAALSDRDRESGEWVPVDDAVAAAALDVDLARRAAEIKAAKQAMAHLDALRRRGD